MCDLRDLNRNDQQCGVRNLKINIADANDNKHTDAYQRILVYNYKGKWTFLGIDMCEKKYQHTIVTFTCA